MALEVHFREPTVHQNLSSTSLNGTMEAIFEDIGEIWDKYGFLFLIMEGKSDFGKINYWATLCSKTNSWIYTVYPHNTTEKLQILISTMSESLSERCRNDWEVESLRFLLQTLKNEVLDHNKVNSISWKRHSKSIIQSKVATLWWNLTSNNRIYGLHLVQ